MTTKEFENIVDIYANRVCRFADRLLCNREMAKDITQDAFTKLWENKSKVELSKVKSWLFTVAYRDSLKQLESQKRTSYEIEDLELSIETNTNNLTEVLEMGMDTLSDIQKSVLLLRDYEGYSYEEIAEISSLTESQVKVYIFRARQKMKDFIKNTNLVC
jgi:RNA polymerase sigma-70 factor (ECF subfamily)